MASIDHVTVRASDLEASLELFARVFELLEFAGERRQADPYVEWNDFSVAAADAEHPATRNVHIGFAASSREQVERWWSALTAAGYADDGPPGLRPEYGPGYYGAFIRDGDQNSLETVHHESSTPATGLIDHVWVRVRDLEESKRFYAAIAPVVGMTARERSGGRLQLICDSGTVSVLAGVPTQNLHLAFGVPDNETVAHFHEAALAAGGRDNGRPGKRPHYHPGYYGAFALDPGSNNIEAVCHNR